MVKGLSAEEKRVKLLEIFHETKDFYQLKELEKLGPKMKGIVSQSVKEVLQGLVDDGLVQSEKIGSSNFFWSFPSQHGAAIEGKLAAAREAQAGYATQLAELKANIAAEKTIRPETEGRALALQQLANKKKQLIELKEELGRYGSSDPVRVEEIRRGITLAKEAAVRWTDNYASLFSYFLPLTGMDPSDMRKHLEVEEDYEDIC